MSHHFRAVDLVTLVAGAGAGSVAAASATGAAHDFVTLIAPLVSLAVALLVALGNVLLRKLNGPPALSLPDPVICPCPICGGDLIVRGSVAAPRRTRPTPAYLPAPPIPPPVPPQP